MPEREPGEAQKRVDAMNLCQHCHKKKPNRPRGLCWGCSRNPAIHGLYPSQSKFAPRNGGDFNGGYQPPAEPTSARPGTRRKIKVLAERVLRREALWHEQDGRLT